MRRPGAICGGALFVCAATGLACALSGEDKSAPPVPAPVLLKSYDGGEGNYRGSPVVVDLYGDGRKEIVTTQWGAVLIHAPDGKKLHELKVSGRVYSGAVVGDVDGDKRIEIAAGDNQGNVHAWRADGTPLPGFPQKVQLAADIRQIAVADLDGDGKAEVIAYSSLTDRGCEPNMYVFQGDGSIRKGWPRFSKTDPFLGQHFDHAGGFNNCLAVGDLDGDRKLDLVMCQDYGSVCVFHDDGRPFEIAKGYQELSKAPVWWGECRAWVPQTSEKVKWGPGKTHLLEFTYSPPLIADLDLDGRPEILAVPNTEDPAKVGPITGSCLIVRNVDFTPKPGFAPWKLSDKAIAGEGTGAKFEANPCVVAGNVAGDARREVLVAHLDGTLRAYGPDGADLWKTQVAKSAVEIVSEPLLADLDGDAKAEIILTVSDSASKSGKLLVVDGAGRTRLEFPLPYHNQAAPTLADDNGDGVPELIVAAFNKGASKDSVFVYSWPCVNPKGVQWPTGRGDFGHTGWLRSPSQASEPAPDPRKGRETPRTEPAARPKVNAEALASWREKLRVRVEQGIQSGQKPAIRLKLLEDREESVKVVGADAQSLRIEFQGNALPLAWNRLAPRDCLGAARAFLKEGVAEDHLLAAVFALADGKTELAEEQFVKVLAADPQDGAARVAAARSVVRNE